MAFLSFPSPTQLRNLTDPSSSSDAATKAYVDASLSGGTGTITVANVTATGNITANAVVANNANLGNTVDANYFVGNGSYLTNVSGSNITGQVANALVAGTVYINAQPNITSLGTLTDLSVTGNASIGNVKTDHLLYANGNAYTIASFTNDSGYLTSADMSSYATQTDVSNAVANLVASAPAALDTLKELADALGNDASFSTTITNQLANTLSASDFSSTANTWIATQTTSNLTEGTNQYFTTTRANSAIDARVTTSFVDSLGANANVANIAYAVAGANVSGEVAYANVANSVAGANVSGQVGNSLLASTVYTNAQPNITSVGTLSSLTVDGTVNLGNISNITISGGTANYVLQTDGAGNLSWVAPAGGSPVLPDVSIDQFTGDGSNNSFQLSVTPDSKSFLIVNVDGVLQLSDAYTLTTDTVSFGSTPTDGSLIEIRTLVTGAGGSSGGGSGTVDWGNVAANILPSANITYNLGSPTKRWKDLYLSGSTIDLAGATIKTDGTTGAITLVPKPTADTPDPTGVVITASGTFSTVSTLGGVIQPTDLTQSISNSETYASITYVDDSIANLVNSAPAALDTLKELSDALGNDASYSTTITNSLANKLSTTSFTSTADTWLATKTTTNVTEGTNLYYTVARANTAIDARVTKSFVDSLGANANIANVALSVAVANVTGIGNIAVINKDGNASNILYGNGVFAAAPSGGGASVTVNSTPPSSPTAGGMWYDNGTTGELYVYDGNTWVTTSIMPMTTVADPAVTGPTQANEVSTQTYTITNYNASYAYIVSVTGGTFTRTAGSISWTMPAVTSNTTHYMTTQVVSGGVTSSIDTRTVLVVNLNIDDTAVVVTDFSYNSYNSGWTL
jgi:hypothetical protein